jgi:hypothetical protein
MLKGEIKFPDIIKFNDRTSTTKNVKVIGITEAGKLVIFEDFYTIEEVVKFKEDIEIYNKSIKFFNSSDELVAAITITDGVIDLIGANVAKSNGENLVTDINGITADTNGSITLDFKRYPIILNTDIINFEKEYQYGTPSNYINNVLTNSLVGARIGIIQKIYSKCSHNPIPINWVILNGEYVINSYNIIYAEWCESARVECWIIQEP